MNGGSGSGATSMSNEDDDEQYQMDPKVQHDREMQEFSI